MKSLEQQWDAPLTLFDFTINYRSGRSNANADALSRQPHGPVPDETEEPKEDELLHIEFIVAMATSVPPDLSHALVTTPIPTEVRQMAVHEPDHNLSTTNPSSDKDKKLPRDDTVIATTSFPTLTKAELITMQKADPTIKEFLKFWEKGMKPTLAERKKLSHQCATLLQQWDRITREQGLIYRIVQDPKIGELKQLLLPATLSLPTCMNKTTTKMHDIFVLVLELHLQKLFPIDNKIIPLTRCVS